MNRYFTSTFLAAAVMAAALAGCNDRDTSTTSTPTNGPAERAGRAVDNAGRNTANAAQNAADRTGAAMDRAADRTGAAVNNTADRTNAAAHNAADRTASDMNTAADRTAAGVNAAADNTANAANNAADRTANAGNTATTQPGGVTSNVPGMPSVNGTSTSGMTTADAAAQRLIDNARNNLKQNDVSKAKTLLSELKDKGMYDSLSSTQKAKVDELERDINTASSGATAQEQNK